MANITNIPAPRVPFIDERTGLISREWFRFLNNQFVLTGSGTTATSIADLEVGLGLSPDTDDVTAVLQTEIEDLQKAPPYLETILSNLSKLNYGMFYDTTDQAAAVINTAYPITFNTTSVALGTYRGTPTSRIYVSTPAVYNFAFSVQLDKTSGGLARMYFWGRKNGTNIAESARHVHLQGNNNENVYAANLYVEMGGGDYFELVWSTDDTTAQLEASVAAAPVPAIPSVILTVNQVNI
jgi:hypothetical protein